MNFLVKLAPYAKAVVAFIALLVPFLVSLAVVINDVFVLNKFDDTHITTLGAAFAALVAGTGFVYQTPNAPKNVTK